MDKHQKDALKRERVWILTDRDLIEGTLFQPQDIRLSDAINAQAAQRDRPYIALTDAVVTRIESGRELISTRFLLVSRNQIVVMMPRSEVLGAPLSQRAEPLAANRKHAGLTAPAGDTSQGGHGLRAFLRPENTLEPRAEAGWASVETGPPPPSLGGPVAPATWPLHGPGAEVEALVNSLKQKDSTTRLQALVELERLGADARAAVPALVQALRDKNSTVREWSAMTLAKIGPDASAAQAALVQALEDKVEAVRRRAVMALRRIDPEAKISLNLLLGLTRDRDEFVREWAVTALGHLGPDAKSAVPVLVDALDDEVDFVRRVAADALGKIGADAAEALPALTRTLKDADVLARYWAAEAIKRIGGNGNGKG